MNRTEGPRARTVNASGADAGRILRGASYNNRGLRLLLSDAQRPGRDGAIIGRFVIVDAGDNKHTPSLTAFLHRLTDAAEVLAAIRRRQPGCVHVVNTNLLTLEPEIPPAPASDVSREMPAIRPPAPGRARAASDPDRFLG